LASGVVISQPTKRLDTPAPHTNQLVQTKSAADSISQPQNPLPAIDSSSPFSKTYFEENIPATSSDALPSTNIPTTAETPPLSSYSETSPAPQSINAQPSSGGGKRVLLSVVSVLILCSVIAGGYFYWKTRSSQQIAQAPPQPIVTPQEPPQEPVQINPLSEKYSSQNPNYLSIDAAAATPESIRILLKTTADEVGQSGLTVPIEFTVTDTNNNPVAFHIFCALAKIDLPANLLSALKDTFSLYVFSDASNVRVGLSVDLKNKTTATAEIKALENKLPVILSPLLLEDGATPQSPAFKDGSYTGLPIRYMNLDQSSTLSIDYTVNETAFIIGTSKDTLRAILDKAAQNGSSTQTQPSSSAPASDNASTGATGDMSEQTAAAASPQNATPANNVPADTTASGQ